MGKLSHVHNDRGKTNAKSESYFALKICFTVVSFEWTKCAKQKKFVFACDFMP